MLVCFLCSCLGSASAAAGVMDVFSRSAGTDLVRVEEDVVELATMARTHIDEVGLADAVEDFRAQPWVRDANGLHLWGVTVTGMSWFDAGHPDLVGLDVSGMSDIQGRPFQALAVSSADGTGDAIFEILYPHPKSGKAARGLHHCFMLEDGQRVLCAGAFEEVR
jgi:hypothetical protein